MSRYGSPIERVITQKGDHVTDTLWTATDIQRYLQVSRRTFYRMRESHPDFPRPLALGRRTLRWDPETIRAWARAKKEAI